MQAWAATQPLKDAGVQLFQNRSGTGVRKLMVIDESLVRRQFHYTDPANTLNDENNVVGDLEEDSDAAKAAQSAVASFALGEINRIISDLPNPSDS